MRVMATEMAMEMDDLDRLAAEAFRGLIVRKDLVRQFRGHFPVPTYVVEFMLGPLLENPNRVGHALRGELEGLWAARRGPYRVVYEIDERRKEVRVLGMGTVYATAVAVFGGTTQPVIAALIEYTGDPLSPAWYMIGFTVLGLIASLQSRLGLAVLMASHDLGALAAVARRVLVMYAGTLVETGTPAQVL